MTEWHILTGEYPPQPGGVADYTRAVARGLADRGQTVVVWAPAVDRGALEAADGTVSVRRLPDHFGPRGLAMLGRELERRAAPRRLLVQYVPHAFGYKAANVAFCGWLRARQRDSIWVMFHEVAYVPGPQDGVRRWALGGVTRLMASLVASSAERAFVSIPGWCSIVESLVRPGTPVQWLPVPSSIVPVRDPAGAAAVHARYARAASLVGHFGTYGQSIRSMLAQAIHALAAAAPCGILLIGRDSDAFARELATAVPELADRVHGCGIMPPDEVSRHVAACDVMLQPYPDGVSTRRTSAMVALAHGRPLVASTGWLTEPLWEESGALVLTPAEAPEALGTRAADLLSDPARLAALSARARRLYADRFELSHTIAALSEPATGPGAGSAWPYVQWSAR